MNSDFKHMQVTVALSHGVKKRNELRKVSRRKEEEKRQEKGSSEGTVADWIKGILETEEEQWALGL